MTWCLHPTTNTEHFVPGEDDPNGLCKMAVSHDWLEGERGDRRCRRCEQLVKVRGLDEPRLSPTDEIANLRFALGVARAALGRPNDLYEKGYGIIQPNAMRGRAPKLPHELDRFIEEWGLQGAINDIDAALAGRPVEGGPVDPEEAPHA